MTKKSPSELVIIGVAIALILAGMALAMSLSPKGATYPHGPRLAISVKAISKLGAVIVPPSFVVPIIGGE